MTVRAVKQISEAKVFYIHSLVLYVTTVGGVVTFFLFVVKAGMLTTTPNVMCSEVGANLKVESGTHGWRRR